MSDHVAYALSAVDGRYAKKVIPLKYVFSLYGITRYRVIVEIEYLVALCAQLKIAVNPDDLRSVYLNWTPADYKAIHAHELKCNHDIKAIEYFLQERLADLKINEHIHFAITSNDINNTAIPMALKAGINEVYLPALKGFITQLKELADSCMSVSMLSRTHGQPATPTILGKELYVFLERVCKQIRFFDRQDIYQAKFGGAVGNFNAHVVAHPTVDWPKFADTFIENMGLIRQQYTTQISHYDDLAEIFDCMRRINVILIGFARDTWGYISIDYFKLQAAKNEVGSSTMPHKVNPIDFENAEGNLGMANASFNHFSEKLPISRFQRDLSDSTVLRNIGVPIGHSIIAFDSLVNGLKKLSVNHDKIHKDLADNWVVIAEAVQTILRREAVPDAYEMLKAMTRGTGPLTAESFTEFIDTLPVSDEVKAELKMITPFNYVGVLPK